MKRVLNVIAVLSALSCGLANAGNGIKPELIQYRNWSGERPNVTTVVSGSIGANVPLFVWRYNVSWTAQDRSQVENQRKQLCDLVNSAMGEKCSGPDSPAIAISEIFLGAAKDFSPSPVANENRIGVPTLASIPPGATRVLHLSVATTRNKPAKEVAAIAFDDQVSDDALRQIAYEDGVLRVVGYRED
ncbi:MAG: hypothetical protein K8H75_11875 [Sulfuricella sp.]|nr:hypothetical protein [Sulfuricella sp.]